MSDMLSTQARKATEFARDEAVRLCHDYIGTEHLLLGLIKQNESKVIDALNATDIVIDDLRTSIEEVVSPSSGDTMTMGQIPLTHRSKKALEVAGQEARTMKSELIEPEHIFLALLKDKEGVACQILSMYAYDYKDAYEAITGIQSPEPRGERVEFPIAESVIKLFAKAREEATRLGNSMIGITHFVLAIIQMPNDPAFEIIQVARVNFEELKTALENLVSVDDNHEFRTDLKNRKVRMFIPEEKPDPKYTKMVGGIMINAYRVARNRKYTEINTTSLLLAILENTTLHSTRLLNRHGLNFELATQQVMAAKLRK